MRREKRMDTYFDIDKAPLKYHNFLKFFGLPVSVLLTIAQFFSISRDINEAIYNGLYYDVVRIGYEIDIIFGIAIILANCITLYGFYTWKPCGYYGILGSHIVNMVHSLVAIGYCAIYVPEGSLTVWGGLFMEVIILIPVWIYYAKRRPLFFEDMRDEYWHRQRAMAEATMGMKDKSGDDPTRCRCCGEKLNAGRTECMRCGASVLEMTPEKPAGYCTQCGNKLDVGSNFCGYCGKKV